MIYKTVGLMILCALPAIGMANWEAEVDAALKNYQSKIQPTWKQEEAARMAYCEGDEACLNRFESAYTKGDHFEHDLKVHHTDHQTQITKPAAEKKAIQNKTGYDKWF